ncbi:MAG: hypothetical protein GX801_10775 [Fibrobacter sp.]|nr:hypothetical protein [Fibrobacter sp.]
MTISLTDLRNALLEEQLAFLWRSWVALGVSGYGEAADMYTIIDPEALLLYTLEISRYDSRLYDEVWDWCSVNGQFFAIPRLKRLLQSKAELTQRQIAVLADVLGTSTTHKKWKALQKKHPQKEEPVNLFKLKNGDKLPITGALDPQFLRHDIQRHQLNLRGYSQPFNPDLTANLLLKLRSFMSATARCEIVVALIAGTEKHPALVARETGYYQKTIQDTMVEMLWSGLLATRQRGREKLYRLSPAMLQVVNPHGKISYPNWIAQFTLLENLWKIVDRAVQQNISGSALLLLANQELKSYDTPQVLRCESELLDLFRKIAHFYP